MKFEYYGWDDGTALYHFGILGQKWGIRRWQNEDGSFNDAGKIRYGRVSLAERRKAKFQNLDGSYTDKGKEKNYKELSRTVGSNFNRYGQYSSSYNDAYIKTSPIAKQILSSDLASKYLSNYKWLLDNDEEEALLECYEKYEKQARRDAQRDFKSNNRLRTYYDNVFDEYYDNTFEEYYRPYIAKDKKYQSVLEEGDRLYAENQNIVRNIVSQYYGDSDNAARQKNAERYIEYMLQNQH